MTASGDTGSTRRHDWPDDWHDEPDDRYLAVHLHEVLLADPRVGEQDLEVEVVGSIIRVSGTVATEARRRAIADVVIENVPDRSVANDATVVRARGPAEPEAVEGAP